MQWPCDSLGSGHSPVRLGQQLGRWGFPLGIPAQTPQEQRGQAGLGHGQASGRGGRGLFPGQCPAASRWQLLLMPEDPEGLGFTSDEALFGGCSDVVHGRGNSAFFSMSVARLESHRHSPREWNALMAGGSGVGPAESRCSWRGRLAPSSHSHRSLAREIQPKCRLLAGPLNLIPTAGGGVGGVGRLWGRGHPDERTGPFAAAFWGRELRWVQWFSSFCLVPGSLFQQKLPEPTHSLVQRQVQVGTAVGAEPPAQPPAPAPPSPSLGVLNSASGETAALRLQRLYYVGAVLAGRKMRGGGGNPS